MRVKAEQAFNIQTLFLNAYFNFDTGTIGTPYVGVGLGSVKMKNGTGVATLSLDPGVDHAFRGQAKRKTCTSTSLL